MEVDRKLIERMVETLKHGDFREGTCCCGDSMEFHSHPMDCGHSPVDMGTYYADKLQEELEALLK